MNNFLAEHKELVDRQLYEVPIDALESDSRKYFDEDAMSELLVSIEKHAVL